MIVVSYTHDKTTKTWERFKPARAIRDDKEISITQDIIVSPIYFPLGTSKEDFTVTIAK